MKIAARLTISPEKLFEIVEAAKESPVVMTMGDTKYQFTRQTNFDGSETLYIYFIEDVPSEKLASVLGNGNN